MYTDPNVPLPKAVLRTCVIAIFRVFAICFALGVVLVLLAILLKAPPSQRQLTTTAQVVPNHEWKVSPLSTTTPTILKIAIQGTIGTNYLTWRHVKDQLIDSIDGEIKQNQIKAVLLTINSPGGTVEDSDAIYRLISEYKQRLNIPVYAYVEGLCASGGMMIACSADKVFCNQASLLGSVGVIMPTSFNVYDLLNNYGVKTKTITSGKCKDEMNPFREWKEDEGAKFQNIADSYYTIFLNIVSRARPKLTEQVLVNLGASVYPAMQAISHGYADGIVAGIESVMLSLARDQKIESNYQVVELSSRNWFEGILDANQALIPKQIQHQLQVPGMLPQDLQGKFLYLYCPQNSPS
jgi:protease-4